jgi:hypothetical protein
MEGFFIVSIAVDEVILDKEVVQIEVCLLQNGGV